MRRLKPACALALAVSAFVPNAFGAQRETLPGRPDSANLVGLAERYENGESVKRNYREAISLYCQAAAHEDGQAFYNLGWMYLNGRGVPRDDATAVMWLQKAAAHGVQQAANLLQLLPGVTPAGARPCAPPRTPSATNIAGRPGVMPTPPAEVRAAVDETAGRLGINPRLLMSVIKVESGFNSQAVSPKSAAGLMQLMPATAARFGVRDPFDARENVLGGATYLRSLLHLFNGNLTLTLAAYNAGEKRVLDRGGVPPYRETVNYVAAVKGLCACGE